MVSPKLALELGHIYFNEVASNMGADVESGSWLLDESLWLLSSLPWLVVAITIIYINSEYLTEGLLHPKGAGERSVQPIHKKLSTCTQIPGNFILCHGTTHVSSLPEHLWRLRQPHWLEQPTTAYAEITMRNMVNMRRNEFSLSSQQTGIHIVATIIIYIKHTIKYTSKFCPSLSTQQISMDSLFLNNTTTHWLGHRCTKKVMLSRLKQFIISHKSQQNWTSTRM